MKRTQAGKRPRHEPGTAAPRRPDLRARETRPRWRRALPFGLITLLVMIVHANALPNGLVYDDKNILLSPLLHAPWNLKAFFANHFYPDNGQDVRLYRPLSNLGYVVNYRINELFTGNGADPIGFHLVGVLMHAGAACLLFAWLRQLGTAIRIALSAALLFAVLPIHSEVVASVYNRSEAQAAVFGLVFLILHRRGAWLLAAPAYLLAMWSKESAIVFLPLAVMADFVVPSGDGPQVERRRRLGWGHNAVFVIVALVWMSMRADALHGVQDSLLVIENPLRFARPLERVLTACKLQLAYLRLQVFPLELSTDYSFRQIPIVSSLIDPGVVGFLVALAGASALAWIMRKRDPIVSFAVIGYAVCFSTTSNYLVPIGTLMAERLAYCPSLFIVVLAAVLIWKSERWLGPRVVMSVMAAILVVCSAKSATQNRFWKDELTLFAEQARTAPNSAKAHINYGIALDASANELEQQAGVAAAQGQVVEQSRLRDAALDRRRQALSHFEHSAQIFDQYGYTHFLIGNVLRALHQDPERIVASYRDAIRIDPWLVDARVNLATTLIELGRVDEARPIVAEIAINDPRHPSLAALQRLLASAASVPVRR